MDFLHCWMSVSLLIIHVAIPYTYAPAVGQATVPVQQTVGVKCVVAEHRGNDHSLKYLGSALGANAPMSQGV